MSVDIFTLAQFEAALPRHNKTGAPLCHCKGLVEGEYEFFMPIDEASGIVIRSSIGRDGISADTGEDSIRAWLADLTGAPLGSKVSRWTTRISGWDKRLADVLRTLWSWRKKAGNCPNCGAPKQVFKVKKEGPNKGRIFAKCGICGAQPGKDAGWVWLTEAK